jgi:hypothetical protein
MNSYPQTLNEWIEWLNQIEAQLAAQGRVVDDRLLKRRDQVARVIQDWMVCEV